MTHQYIDDHAILLQQSRFSWPRERHVLSIIQNYPVTFSTVFLIEIVVRTFFRSPQILVQMHRHKYLQPHLQDGSCGLKRDSSAGLFFL